MIAPARAPWWRSFLLIAGVLVMSGWVVAAQPPGGGFDFPEEEEEEPSWSDDIRAQAVDLGLVVAFSALAAGEPTETILVDTPKASDDAASGPQ